MPAPIFSSPDLDFVAKEVYPAGSPYWDWIARGTPAKDLIESSGKVPFGGEPQGKYHKFPIVLTGNANPAVPYTTGQKATGLASPGKVGGDELFFGVATLNQALEIEGDVFNNIVGGASSAADGFTLNMDTQGKDASSEFNWKLHQDGSGRLAIPTAWVPPTFTVADNSRMWPNREFVIRANAGGAYWNPGGGGYPTGFSPGHAAEVLTQNPNGTAFTAAFASGLPIGEVAVAMANVSCFPYDAVGNDIWGLGMICSDQDPACWAGPGPVYLGGMSRATQPLWQGYVHNAGGDMLSMQNDVQVVLDHLRKRSRGQLNADARNVLWYAFCGAQNFHVLENALTVGDRTPGGRKTLVKEDRMGDGSTYRAEYSGIEYEGAVFVLDFDSPPSRVRFVHPAHLRRWVVMPWGWDDRSGTIWTRSMADDGRDAWIYKARMMTQQQLICVCCLGMGEIWNTSATL